MIRAINKSDNTYVYIYYIYETADVSNKKCTYYLCSLDNYDGLLALSKDEVDGIEVLNNTYIHLHEVDPSAGCNDLIHPVLYDFLENYWDEYEEIVEGIPEAFLKFEEKLGHRP